MSLWGRFVKKIFVVIFLAPFFASAVVMIFGFALKTWDQHKKSSYEQSLFPRVAAVRVGNELQCDPSFINFTSGQIGLYCHNNPTDPDAREELRIAVRNVMRAWAAENDLNEHFLFVGFVDELSSRPSK
jgi:hypothetical protein